MRVQFCSRCGQPSEVGQKLMEPHKRWTPGPSRVDFEPHEQLSARSRRTTQRRQGDEARLSEP